MSSGTIVEFYMQEDTGVFYFSVQEIPEDILKIHTRKKKRKKKPCRKHAQKQNRKKQHRGIFAGERSFPHTDQYHCLQ